MAVKIPKSLAAVADKLDQTKDAIDELKAKIKPLDELRIALEQHLIDNLPKSQASGISGRLVQAQIVTEEVPSVEDWPKLYKYILKQNAFDLMQRRISATAVRERWADHKAIPGVKVFKRVSVKLTKLKGKAKPN